MSSSKASSGTNPEAYWNVASNFCDAADELLRVAKKRKVDLDNGKFTKPIQLLYFHSIESSLKAFLGTMGATVPKGHEIAKYHKECLRLGLRSDRKLDDVNAVGLQAANVDHGIRYYNTKSHWQPSLSIVKRGSRFILEAVATEFTKRGLDPKKPGKAVKLVVTVGVAKPR